MDFLRKMVVQAKKTIESGYYENGLVCACKRLSFKEAVEKANKKGKVALICEIKPSSPSQGALFSRHSNFDAGKLALKMQKAGATAISVLAEPRFFGGSLESVCKAKKATLNIPILFKDFVFEKRQLAAAKKSGADCVLLIFSFYKKIYGKKKALDKMRESAKYAHALGLEVLMETHSLEEFNLCQCTGGDLIAINNRNLSTLEMDATRVEKILRNSIVPKSALVVGASGFQAKRDVESASRAGVHAVLVGTSLSKARRKLEEKIKELAGVSLANNLFAFSGKRRKNFAFVKVCGITRKEDARIAVEAGADAVGVVVGKSTLSPRKVSFSLAKKIFSILPQFVLSVAVCVPKDSEELVEVAKKSGAQVLQVHGRISNSEIAKAKILAKTAKKLGSVKIIRCVPVKENFDFKRAFTDAQKIADAIVLDSRETGGFGKVGDWSASALLCKKSKVPVILAGGLEPDNVEKAILKVNSFGVDASTGLEGKRMGVKDAGKVRAFVLNAKKTLTHFRLKGKEQNG